VNIEVETSCEGDAESERRGIAEGRVPISAPPAFIANDCLDIGIVVGSPVSLDYSDKAPFKFNGAIEQVQVKYVPRNSGAMAPQ